MKLQSDIEIKQKEEERRFSEFVQIKNLEQNIIKKFKFSPTTERYDASIVSGNTVMIAEIKVRADKNIAYFEKWGPFLELKKIQGMQVRQDEINNMFGHLFPSLEKYYFNFCSDGVMVYKLEDPWDYNFQWWKLPKNNTNPEILVNKMVHCLKNPVEIIRYER